MTCPDPDRVHHGVFAIIASVLASAGIACAADGPRSVTVEACTTCHGPGGISHGTMPTIAGMDSETLAEVLLAFRDGSLESTVMGRLVGPLSDEDIAGIAAYFAALPGADQ